MKHSAAAQHNNQPTNATSQATRNGGGPTQGLQAVAAINGTDYSNTELTLGNEAKMNGRTTDQGGIRTSISNSQNGVDQVGVPPGNQLEGSRAAQFEAFPGLSQDREARNQAQAGVDNLA